MDKKQQMQILSSANNMHYKHLPMVWCSLGFNRINTIYNVAMESSPMSDRDDGTLGFPLYVHCTPSRHHWHFVNQPKVIEANAICTNICVNRTARQLEGDIVKQADEQW